MLSAQGTPTAASKQSRKRKLSSRAEYSSPIKIKKLTAATASSKQKLKSCRDLLESGSDSHDEQPLVLDAIVEERNANFVEESEDESGAVSRKSTGDNAAEDLEEEHQKHVSTLNNKENEKPPPKVVAEIGLGFEDKQALRNRQISHTRKAILDLLTERAIPAELVGLENEYRQVHSLLQRTIARGESNSCLIIGARGSGKTMIVRRALQELSRCPVDGQNVKSSDAPRITAPSTGAVECRKPRNGSGTDNRQFLQINLSGLTQTDDKLALREIARQMSIETDADDDAGKGSFADAFNHILDTFRASGRETMPIVFILDEFDLFAEHPRQSLLYTLFDLCQGGQTPMAVVGTTCRLNALELLEKRVKSRFSHRQIHLSPPETFKEFLQIGKNALMQIPEQTEPTNDIEYITTFNAVIEEIFAHPTFSKMARKLFDLGKNVRAFLRIFMEPACKLSPQNSYLTVEHVCEVSLRQRADAKTEMLLGVSVLELCLIVAMKRQYDQEISSFNFEMIYDEYKEFLDRSQASGSHTLKRATKAVALKAFEHLQSFELVRPVENIARCPKEYRMMRLLLEPAQVTEAVMRHSLCPMLVQKWATKWLAS